MNAPESTLVVFGNGRMSSLARYCIEQDGLARVIAYTVDEALIEESEFEALPLVPFERLEAFYPPDRCTLLIPIGYRRINGVRRERFESARARGYRFFSYVSRRASTWPDLRHGDNVTIYEHAIVQPFVRIGDNSIIRSGAHVSHHCEIGDHVFVSAEVAMGGGVWIGDQAFIGVGAVLRDNVRIAPRSFIGAGALVVKDTEADGVYVGNPARRIAKTALEVTRE